MHQCHPIPPMFIASPGTCEKATQWQRALQLLHLARQSKVAANVVTIAAVTWWVHSCTLVMWCLHNIKIGCRNYHETQCCV